MGDYLIINTRTGFEDSRFNKFPYKILMRCCSMLERAEECYTEFCEDYSQYIDAAGESTADYVHFSRIPVKGFEKYVLSFGIENFGQVTEFCIEKEGV